MSAIWMLFGLVIELTLLMSVKSTCDSIDVPPLVTINETDQVGTVVASFSHSGDTEFDLDIHVDGNQSTFSDSKLKGYFTIHTVNNETSIVVTRVPDLEALYVLVGEIQELSLEIICNSIEDPTSEVFKTTLVINAVDEFQPVFVGAPFKVLLPEDTEVGTVVFDLQGLVRDNDVLSPQEITFRIHQYGITEFDGRYIFYMPELNGKIYLGHNLDFEPMKKAGRLFFMLNVSAQDSGGLMAHTTVNFTITDVDDLGPAFDLPGCLQPCEYVSLTAYTTQNYTGILETEPWRLKARDQDTLKSQVIYKLQDDENITDYFDIDKDNGTLYQVQSLVETDFVTTVLQIEAVEIDCNRTIYANITVNVTDRGAGLTTDNQNDAILKTITV